MRTRVKICGITRPEDARAAVAAGADAIGLVFHPASPRCVGIAQAQAIARVLPPFVQPVALFVDAPPEAVRAVLAQLPGTIAQFHGDETPEACAACGHPYIKALRVRDDVDLAQAARRYEHAAALLFDTYDSVVAGGSGRCFDWSRVPRVARPVILAGGLDAENVRDAVARVQPYAVDVSSGVEARPGIKDAGKIEAFMRAVRESNGSVELNVESR